MTAREPGINTGTQQLDALLGPEGSDVAHLGPARIRWHERRPAT